MPILHRFCQKTLQIGGVTSMSSTGWPPRQQTLTGPRPRTWATTWTTTRTGESLVYGSSHHSYPSCYLNLPPESRQFKWFNPSNVDYSTISDKRGAPNYRCWKHLLVEDDSLFPFFSRDE